MSFYRVTRKDSSGKISISTIEVANRTDHPNKTPGRILRADNGMQGWAGKFFSQLMVFINISNEHQIIEVKDGSTTKAK